MSDSLLRIGIGLVLALVGVLSFVYALLIVQDLLAGIIANILLVITYYLWRLGTLLSQLIEQQRPESEHQSGREQQRQQTW